MNIVFAASEVAPYSKTGGLADVVGALPRRLRAMGHSVWLVTPLHRCVREAGWPLVNLGVGLSVPLGGRAVAAKVYAGQPPRSDARALFVDQPEFFDRPSIYGYGEGDYADNCARFAFFSRAVLEALRTLRLRADVLHLHDWQTALIPLLQRDLYAADPFAGAPATLLTIHNLEYQGVFWHWDMPLTGLGWERFRPEEMEFHGHINFLKGGLVHADLLNTVSPTYAAEIRLPENGHGLDGVLRDRGADLRGIVNGLDEGEWNPAEDAHLPAQYSAEDPSGKAACKSALRRELGLSAPTPGGEDAPLAAFVGRLAAQKGPDVLADAAQDLLAQGVQLAVLAAGDEKFAERFAALARAHPGKAAFAHGFDPPLAHRILGGADMVLMPSRREPCGLVQLAGLKYGAVPIVHRTGGLADTVADTTPDAVEKGTATGFCFGECTAKALAGAVARAAQAYARPETWRAIRRAGMEADWSWRAGARQYAELYARAAEKRRGEGNRLSIARPMAATKMMIDE